MKYFALVFGLVIFSLPLSAEKFLLDTNQSQLMWEGRKIASGHNGTISFSSGEAEIVKDKIVASNFIVDMHSIKNTDIKDPGSNAKLVGHLKSDDFFSVEKFPTARLQITSTQPSGKDKYKMKGNLTIRDKTHPVEFVSEVKKNKDQYLASSTFKIDRTKWDVRYNAKNFFVNLAADKIINNDIEFKANIVLVPSPSETVAKDTENKSKDKKAQTNKKN